jgi:hypothetical protein
LRLKLDIVVSGDWNMNFLNRAYNAAGPVPQKRKGAIIAYFRNAQPSAEDYMAIARTCLNHEHNIRSAVEAINPSFKDRGLAPDGFTVARAIKAALNG